MSYCVNCGVELNPAASCCPLCGTPVLNPRQKADETAQHLVQLGVHAIWNFAHVDLDLSDNQVVVENVHLSDSLMQLSYNIVKNS